MNNRLIAGTMLAAASLHGGAAMAQDAPLVPAADSGQQVGEIVVTATKRLESIQKVPVAVTALDSKMLDRLQISNLSDFGAAIPNTSVARNPSSSTTSLVFMRGIGDDSSSILTELPISEYVDGVYLGTPIGALFDMLGYDRIEVLRGPQGTLYGRNSTGGAIKLVTTRPKFDDLSAQGDFTIGSFSRRDFRGLVNVPVSDTFAANLVVGSSNNHGYYKDPTTGKRLNAVNTQSFRVGALWKPTDRFSLYMTGDYTDDDSGLQVPTQMAASTGAGMDVPLYGGIYHAEPNQPDINHVKVYGVTGTADYRLDFGTLESITAWRGMTMRADYDYGGSDIGADLIRDNRQNQFSEELQFISDFSGPLQLTSGLYYFHSIGHGAEDLVFPGDFSVNSVFKQVSDSYAGYAEGTYSLTDWLKATVGGRVTHDRKEITRYVGSPGTAGKSWTKFTPKANLQAQIARHVMAYVTYSEGYKAGVYQIFPGDDAQARLALAPEKVKSWEVGAKADWFDGKLRTNVSLFDVKYTDLQEGVITEGGGVAAVSADEHAKGVELEVTATPVRNLYLSGNLSLIDTKFTRVPTGSTFPQLGDQQKFTPPVTFHVGGTYDVVMPSGSKVTLGANYSWFDHQKQGFPNYLYTMKSYDLVDASIGFTPPSDKWGLDLMGKNLGNSHYWVYQSYLAGYARYYQPGRTWALRFKFNI